jgi:DNA-binding NtrC family response regulator
MVRVLIVEDQPSVAEVTKLLLEDCYADAIPVGFRCIVSPTLACARNVLARGAVDVVLSDWDLPDGCGEDLARTCDLPVVVYSGGVHRHSERMKKCAHAVLEKPQGHFAIRRALFTASQARAA